MATIPSYLKPNRQLSMHNSLLFSPVMQFKVSITRALIYLETVLFIPEKLFA
jgi:hypothetical protein